MTSPPLDSTHGQQHRAWHDITALGHCTRSATSCVACHYSPWTAHTVRRRRAWHAIVVFGQHRRSDCVRRCMQSSPLASTHSRTTSGVGCHHLLSAAHTVERRQAWHAIIAFQQYNGRTMSGVTCHHRLWTTHIVKRRRAWHAIIAFGKHT